MDVAGQIRTQKEGPWAIPFQRLQKEYSRKVRSLPRKQNEPMMYSNLKHPIPCSDGCNWIPTPARTKDDPLTAVCQRTTEHAPSIRPNQMEDGALGDRSSAK